MFLQSVRKFQIVGWNECLSLKNKHLINYCMDQIYLLAIRGQLAISLGAFKMLVNYLYNNLSFHWLPIGFSSELPKLLMC